MVNPGDLVTRRSYGSDLLFKVVEIDMKEKQALLKGSQMRLLADSPLSDLEPADQNILMKFRKQETNISRSLMKNCMRQRRLRKEGILPRDRGKSYYEIPGNVLHLDGDEDYLQECLSMYKSLGVNAFGESVPEKKMPAVTKKLLRKYSPDLLVITGHDAYLRNGGQFDDLDSYRNSRYFVEAVKQAREYEPGKDTLIIFAGACQSHYEALLASGANFASSPQRVLIHSLDPVLVMEGVGFTPISESVDIFQLIEGTITGFDGIGGIETRGQFRLGAPLSPY